MEDKTLLSKDELSSLPTGWTVDGIFLDKTFYFDNYKQINLFLPWFTQVIVEQNHHPDFEFDSGAKTVHLRMTTHSEGGLTQADLKLASTLNQWESLA
ncbi:MAG: 4a-hydroxytetrahydrobiopterin dehydratase [Lentisphaeria bacterium]|nr:4a-hydroxytetrahydrobiopterin dehydratase [Lentisphaeria bacterium]